MDREKIIKGLEHCAKGRDCKGCPYFSQLYFELADGEFTGYRCKCLADAIALLKEYEKLSEVCFKIEKYLRIADLSILIDRIEEGKVEVLQDDGRPDFMETTIKVRRL